MSLYTNSSGNLSRAWSLASGFSVAGWVKFQAVPTGNQSLFAVDNGSSEITLFGAAEGTVDWYSTGTGNVVPVMTAITGWTYFGFRVSSVAANGITTVTRNAGSNIFTTVLSDGIGAGVTPTTIRIASDFSSQTANATFAGWKIWTAALTDQELRNESTRLAPWRNRQVYSFSDMRSVAGGGKDRYGQNKFTVAGTFVLGASLPPVPELFNHRPMPILSAGGGTNTPMTLTVNQAQSLSFVRGLGVIRSTTETQTRTLVRAVARSLSSTSAQTPSFARALATSRSVTSSSTPSFAKAVGLARAATSAATSSLARGVGLVRAATETQSGAIVRACSRALSATITQTASMTRALGIRKLVSAVASVAVQLGGATLMTLTATITQTASMTRQISRALSATSAQTPSFIRAIARTLSRSASQTPSVSRALTRVLATASAQSASVSRACARALSVTSSATSTFVRALGLSRLVTTTTSPSIRRAIAKVLAALGLQTPSFTRSGSASVVPLVGPLGLGVADHALALITTNHNLTIEGNAMLPRTEGDSAFPLDLFLLDNGKPYSGLAGATVRVRIHARVTGALVVDGAATILDTTTAHVRYAWAPADVVALVRGDYVLRAIVTLSDGTLATWPNAAGAGLVVLPPA